MVLQVVAQPDWWLGAGAAGVHALPAATPSPSSSSSSFIVIVGAAVQLLDDVQSCRDLLEGRSLQGQELGTGKTGHLVTTYVATSAPPSSSKAILKSHVGTVETRPQLLLPVQDLGTRLEATYLL